MDSLFLKWNKSWSFQPKLSGSSLIRALFTLVGVRINLEQLDNKEIYALDKILVDKSRTFLLTDLSSNVPSTTSRTLFSPIVSCSALLLMFSTI